MAGRRKGFLLLEVVVSMTMVASCFLFVGRVYYTAKNVIERSQELFVSVVSLEEAQFDYRIKGEVAQCSTGGEFSDNRGYGWQCEAGAVPPEDTGLYKVAFDVFEGSKGPEDGYSMVTYMQGKKAGT